MKKGCVFIAIIVLLAACNAKKDWQKRAIDNAEKALMEKAKAGK